MPFDFGAQIEEWRKELLNTSKRNPLIKFKLVKDGRSGGISLVYPDPGELWHQLVVSDASPTFPWKRNLIDLSADPDDTEQDSDHTPAFLDSDDAPEVTTGQDVLDLCRRSPRLRTGHLLTELSDRRLAARLTRLALNARESLTEQGTTILYVAFGFLRWFDSPDSEKENLSPLLLVPVRLERDSVEAPWQLRTEEEEILPNHTLAQLMENDFRLRLPSPDADTRDPDDPAWRCGYFAEVEQCIRHHARWEILDEAALGTFNFQKLAMWEDLGRNHDRIKDHDLCRAIAGDQSVALRAPSDLPGEKELDEKILPDQTYHILDADSSQHAAIVAATRGASLILDGPPGTGKSQTIANLIAEFLAAGKTVLFVSEKAAALEVVQRRLKARGLGDFCLECHSHKANKQQVIAELGRCLNLASESYRDPTKGLEQLFETRTQLNHYVRELHVVRQPLGMSAYQVHGELARLERVAGASVCSVPRVLERDAAYLRRLTTEVLARLRDCASVIADRDHHPWRGFRATVYSQALRDDVQHHFGRLVASLRQVIDASALLHEIGFAPEKPTRADWLTALDTARNILACPLVPASWFKTDPRSVAEAVIQLDRVTQAYRQVHNTLQEFVPDRIRPLDPTSLATLMLSTDSGRPGLRPLTAETVRALRQRLGRVRKRLSELLPRAAAADQAAQRVVDLLQLQRSPLPVKQLRQLAQLADFIAGMNAVRPSWWQPARRQELQRAITQWQQEAHAAQDLRMELMTRLSPQAFSSENAPRAAVAARFGWLLMRLLPRWWSLKAQVTDWYLHQPPRTATLIDDMRRLAGYHRRLDYCRQVQEQYAAELVLDKDGQPDWDGTLEGLRALDRLEQETQNPKCFQKALSAEGSLDRGALTVAAAELAQHAVSLGEQLQAAGKEYDFGEGQKGMTHPVQRTARDLALWLKAHVAAIDREMAILDRVCGLLAEGRDLPAAEVPHKIRAAVELSRLRGQITVLCDRIWEGGAPRQAEAHDWSGLRRTAEGLLGFLGTWGQPLPLPLVRALTLQQIRSRLTDTVERWAAVLSGGFDESWKFLTQRFDPSQSVSTGITIGGTPLADLCSWLAARAEDAHRIHEWTQFCEIEREVAKADVTPILTEVLNRRLKPEEATDAFRARFFRLWLDALYEGVSALRQFSTENHERLIGRFRGLDRFAVASAAARVRNLLLTCPDRPSIAWGNAPGSSELGTLLREVNKRRRHMPLRKLFEKIPTLLPRLKPCLMMSPLAVSTYLQSPDLQFDLVLFDEASQVRPHDAICAIYRGRQLIVAGDQKQLPPTDFFQKALDRDDESSEETEEDGADLKDFESVLDVCCALRLPRPRLRWHYRSRREPLIAFSNHHFYDDELVTFPSVHDTADNPPIRFEYMADGRWKSGAAGGFNVVEARRCAALVLEHFRAHPEQSLGVIAFSQRQQMRILDELERLRRATPELEACFHEDRDEPFFVKNLENVQGDERDVMFLSVGYGPDELGKVAMRFGPLNRQGGERRLNVAVTRSRVGMTVVSSLRAQDIDLSRTSAVGVGLLKAYLDYAERGAAALLAETKVGKRGFDSPFEIEVEAELKRHGLTVHHQVGCGPFWIDLAIVDPQAPGRYLLGVECDGATYHSSATARDRDRLRQEVLESLGWRICRIWSTDWVRDRSVQVQRVLKALEHARRQEPAPASSAPAAPALIPKEVDQQVNVAPPAASVPPPTALSYGSIDDVPDTVLRDVVLGLLRAYGATGAGDLIRFAARQLGFERAGPRIQARIEECIEGLIRVGQICRAADERLQLAQEARVMSR
jgi:very-short-patch-repair endonuclease